jgi:hypothetical protein
MGMEAGHQQSRLPKDMTFAPSVRIDYRMCEVVDACVGISGMLAVRSELAMCFKEI